MAVVLGGAAYVGLGCDRTNAYQPDWWRYDPGPNQWTRLADFPAPLRAHAFFALHGKAYVGGGRRLGAGTYADAWEYTPANPTGLAEAPPDTFGCCPNPTTGRLHVTGPRTEPARLHDAYGRLVKTLPPGQPTLDLTGLPAGAYLLRGAGGCQKVLLH